MGQLEKCFWKLTGIKPKYLEPRPSGAELQSMISDAKNGRGNLEQLDEMLKRKQVTEYTIIENGSAGDGDFTVIGGLNCHSELVMAALVPVKVGFDFLSEAIESIPESDWFSADLL